MYTIQKVPGKGRGLVATQKIPKGTRILCESPVITSPKYVTNYTILEALVCKQVEVLEPALQQRFLSMHDVHRADMPYSGIIRTNGLPAGTNGEGAIFWHGCLINHSCDNNAHTHWNDLISKRTVHAIRDIEAGEEITMNYLGCPEPRQVRQEIYRRDLSFDCGCRLCALSEE